MKRFFPAFFLATAFLISALVSLAEGLRFAQLPSLVRPGRIEQLNFEAPSPGSVRIEIRDLQDQLVESLTSDYQAVAGLNRLVWDGYGQDKTTCKPGEYNLVLIQGDQRVTSRLSIGEIAPQIRASVSHAELTPGTPWKLNLNTNMAGSAKVILHIADKQIPLFSDKLPAGDTSVNWDGLSEGVAVPKGSHTITVSFSDESGFPATLQQVTITVLEKALSEAMPKAGAVLTAAPDSSASPASSPEASPLPQKQDQHKPPTLETVNEADYGSSYWTLPVGQWDEEAIWKVMMQPITVLEGGKQTETYKLRSSPEELKNNKNVIGEISYSSQGVHVLEEKDGWALIEVFNSSYGPDCNTRRGWGNSDELIKGYVKSSALKTVKPNEEYGLLVDKLYQKLYVFKEGKHISTMTVSTGLPSKQQPWNETPSGEFMVVSKVGDFPAGNMICPLAMRVNGGCLFHEVPYIPNGTYKDYSLFEKQLGQKASHGCIRVQRAKNAEGMNMTWMWANIKMNTKVLIWDDGPGRYYDYPNADLPLFYNTTGGRYYHLNQKCPSIKEKFLPLKGTLSYSELDKPEFSKLKPCPACNPPIRKTEIEKINKKNGY